MTNNRRVRYQRKKQRIRLFLGGLITVGLILGFMQWNASRQPAQVVASDLPESTTSSSPTGEPTVSDPEEGLQEAVEQFVRFYESPPSPRRTLMLNSFCENPSFCGLLLGIDGVDTSESVKGSTGTKVQVARKEPHEFESSDLDDERVRVLSKTYLRIKQPGEEAYIVSATYETVWVERRLDGWKIVGILTS
jgi:hypothetical protein